MRNAFIIGAQALHQMMASEATDADMALSFTTPPVLVGDAHNSSGPWYGRVNRLSDTHALGMLEAITIATTDGGFTWYTLKDWKNDTGNFGGIYDADGKSFHNSGAALTYTSPSGKNVNITAVHAPFTTRFALSPTNGTFIHSVDKPFSMTGLPHLTGFRTGAAAANLRLPDGRLLSTVVTTGIGSTRQTLLSVVALHSKDDGYTWTYTSFVAAAEDVPYAREGPSENALAYLKNGSIIIIFRVAGESGHHNPYVSKVSDDHGLTWKYLRPLRKWKGEKDAPGCVRPRLITLGNGSLVLAGGRPNPVSHDDLLWLNSEGDGEVWRPYSVSYYHNKLTTNTSWLIPSKSVNDSRWPRYDTSYSSLVKTGQKKGYIFYGAGFRSFALHFGLS